MPRSRPIPLPKGWPTLVRSGVLHAISLAATALTTAWSRASTSRSRRQKRGAETERLRAEIALLEEELAIKDARWARLHPRRRPHFGPVQRMRILQVRAARSWSVSQTAHRFLVTEDTIMPWMRRLDEEGENALVRTEEPVNKFPDFVAYLVRQLKMLCPTLGKVRIAQMLARAGLHLSASTVGRMLKRDLSRDDIAEEMPVASSRGVRARSSNHTWHIDLTTIPTGAGFWVPWFPHARVQSWPFSWWIAIAVDHASRLVVGFAVFKRRPTSAQVCAFLGRAIKRAGSKPKYIIADKGKEFFCKRFKGWCRNRHIRPRFGAVGEHGSIAVIERFIRSMKSECTRRIMVPLGLGAMRNELGCYSTWYNEHRPHSWLSGRTPTEVYRDLPPANLRPRFEPRARWPKKARCAAPNVPVKGGTDTNLRLIVSRLENRAHLPVIELRRAA